MVFAALTVAMITKKVPTSAAIAALNLKIVPSCRSHKGAQLPVQP